MRIDAHQHFWRLAARSDPWPPPELGAIHRDFGPDDLAPILARNGVDATILVQSEPSLADTEYLLSLAAGTSFVAGVVGWVDMAGPDAADRIARLATAPLLRGLRPMLQDMPDADWIARAPLGPAVEAMLRADLSFDALVKPRQLGALHDFAARWPMLRIVIDHGAKPDIAAGDLSQWRQDMTRLAALPNLSCKLSGLLTEAGSPPMLAGVDAAAGFLAELFGAKRLIFGSDWPVLNLSGDYDAWRAMAHSVVAERLSPAALADVFGGNALRFYRLQA